MEQPTLKKPTMNKSTLKKLIKKPVDPRWILRDRKTGETIKVFLIGTNQDKEAMAADLTILNIIYDHNSYGSTSLITNYVNDCDFAIMTVTNSEYAYINETVELGIALGIGKKVWLVCGEKIPYIKANHYLNSYGIKRFNSWDSCLKALYDLRQL